MLEHACRLKDLHRDEHGVVSVLLAGRRRANCGKDIAEAVDGNGPRASGLVATPGTNTLLMGARLRGRKVTDVEA